MDGALYFIFLQKLIDVIECDLLYCIYNFYRFHETFKLLTRENAVIFVVYMSYIIEKYRQNCVKGKVKRFFVFNQKLNEYQVNNTKTVNKTNNMVCVFIKFVLHIKPVIDSLQLKELVMKAMLQARLQLSL